jgi:hypothetical protein
MGQEETRIIYDREWKRFKYIFDKPDFQEWLRGIRKKLTEYGMADIPEGGFTKGQEYFDYLTRREPSERYLERKAEFDAATNKLKAKTLWTNKDWQQFYEIEEHYFPYQWGKEFNECLKDQGLDPKNPEHRSWLDHAIFLNSPDYVRSLAEFKIVWDENLKRPKELWVRLFGYTTFGDIPKGEIEPYQNLLPFYKPRNKKKDDRITIRNQKIFDVYMELKVKLEGVDRKRAKRGQSIYQAILDRLVGEYPKLTIATIRSVLSQRGLTEIR